MRTLKVSLLAFGSLLLSACGYNTLQVQDEATKSAWAEVVNQYQRRADLIPNLVNTVKGYAAQEQAVLLGVTEARAKASQITVNADDPASLAAFQQAQGEVSSALSRLLVTVENYPDLKSDQNFRDLQAQLEGTENRITVARNRFIQTVQDFNVTVRKFPTNLTAMIFGYKVKPNFTVAERGCDLEAADGGFQHDACAGTDGAGARSDDRTRARTFDLRQAPPARAARSK